MTDKIFLLLLIFGVFNLADSQNIVSPFTPINGRKYILKTEDFTKAIQEQKFLLTPFQNTAVQFSERSNFSKELALKYPKIKSYVSNSLPAIYLDIYNGQFNFFTITREGSEFIMPIENTTNEYEWIKTKEMDFTKFSNTPFECGTKDPIENGKPIEIRSKPSDPVQLRTYRLALAVTGEFARNIGTTKEQVLAGLNSHLTRINAVYMVENAIEFKLVSNNDTILFMDGSTDPYTNGNPNLLLNENPGVLNDRIGLNNYDIGHVFGTNTGGVAVLSNVCKSTKGAGTSSTFGVYSGINFFHIPCHEMGHQFSAEHTFNLCDNSNESSGSAFEPGSGSTLMSYAGASDCGANYVQDISDPYFHAQSLSQIKSYSRQSTGSLCGTTTDIGNLSPVVTILSPGNQTIPKQTPFELEGNATDDKPNPLLFNWEEMDLGPKSILGNPIGSAPLFRSFTPNPIPKRIFPSLQFILNGTMSVNEVLPLNTRPLVFRLTARDNDNKGGATTWTDLQMMVTGNAGPFKITSFNTQETIPQKDFFNVKWEVANTDKSPVNCKLVDIFWSNDGGINFEKLVDGTLNDGNEWIIVPSNVTTAGRIKIKAKENVFFDINNANFTVTNTISNQLTVAPFPGSITVCAGHSASIKIKTALSSSADTLFLLMPDNLRAGYSINKNFLVQNDSIKLTVFAFRDALNSNENTTLLFRNSTTNDTVPVSFKLNILSGNIQRTLPVNGQNQVGTRPIFKWKNLNSVSDFKLEVSSTADFKSLVWMKSISSLDTSATIDVDLDPNAIYYWRIHPAQICDLSDIPFSVFHTQALACKVYTANDLPKFISATGTPTITSTINVTDTISLALVTLAILRGNHDFIGDLVTSLKAPSGDSVILWSNLCNNLSNFNLSLDDQAPLPLTCPLTDRKAHQPQNPLSGLLGSASTGAWTLKIQDTKGGSGGSLEEWSLQLCGAVATQGPSAVSNKGIEQLEQRALTVNKNILEYTDSDSNAEQLNIIFINTPGLGTFLLNSKDTIKPGTTITQNDINSGRLSFVAIAVKADTSEKISFIVVDEKNNWTGLQILQIKVLNDPTIAYHSIPDIFQNIKIFPNPIKSNFYILQEENHRLRAEIFNAAGMILEKFNINSRQFALDLNGFRAGIYFLRVFDINEKRMITFKLVKI